MSEATGATATAEPSTKGAAPVAPAGAAVETLQKQVREKDQLVAALTERLEQAAEQLDRLRRTGVDKGHRPLAGAVPPEMLADQKQTLEELKKFVGNWEEIQPGAALQRIETQVLEIRNLISNGASAGASAPASAAGSAAAHGRERPGASPAAATAASASAGRTSSAPGTTANSSWWEKQKAALMGEGSPDGDPAQASPTASNPTAPGADPAAPAANGQAGSDEAPAAISLGETVIPELPAAVNFDELTLEAAIEAIRERDRLIQQLREPLLLLKAAGQLPRDLQSLEHLSPALRQKLDELETQWQARFRQAELDLSLERARLAREQSQTRQQQELLNKQLKQNGGAPRAADDAGGDDDGSRRRWFRFMGKSDGSKEPVNGDSN